MIIRVNTMASGFVGQYIPRRPNVSKRCPDCHGLMSPEAEHCVECDGAATRGGNVRRIYKREEIVGALAGAVIAGMDEHTLRVLAAVFTIQWAEVVEVVGMLIEGEIDDG